MDDNILYPDDFRRRIELLEQARKKKLLAVNRFSKIIGISAGLLVIFLAFYPSIVFHVKVPTIVFYFTLLSGLIIILLTIIIPPLVRSAAVLLVSITFLIFSVLQLELPYLYSSILITPFILLYTGASVLKAFPRNNAMRNIIVAGASLGFINSIVIIKIWIDCFYCISGCPPSYGLEDGLLLVIPLGLIDIIFVMSYFSLKKILMCSDEIITTAHFITRLVLICAAGFFLIITSYFIWDYYQSTNPGWLIPQCGGWIGRDWYDEFFGGILLSIILNISLSIMMCIGLSSFIKQMLLRSWMRKVEIEIFRMKQEINSS